MDSESDGVVVPPEEFQFPFPPYEIQKDFMRELFHCLQDGKLGIFESPTGTGKSLSLICGSLTWFLESEKANRTKLEEIVNDKSEKFEDDDDDWFAAAGRKQIYNQKRLEAKKKLDRIKSREEKLANIRRMRGEVKQAEYDKNKDDFEELFKEVKSIKKAVERELSQGPGDEDILLEEYFSDDERDGDDFEEEEEEDNTTRRIYFCSRTHSQLSQFVREVKKSPFHSSVSLVSLASRGVMCVNPSVKKLQSQSAINEACLELGRNKSKPRLVDQEERTVKKSRQRGGGGCPYNKVSKTGELRDQSLLAIHDIEDLVTAGKRSTSCPYYASRSAVSLAQLVVLPYNTLLHAATRKALGLNLKNSIVIIDEAHNLLDTITNIHTVSLSGAGLGAALSQLQQYKQRYSSRLKAKNLLYIKQILFILSSFVKLLGGVPGKDPREVLRPGAKEETKLIDISAFLSESQIYNLNLAKLIKYCNVSQICYKLNGFVEKYKPSQSGDNKPVAGSGVSQFLKSINSKESVSGVSSASDPPAVSDENSVPANCLQPVVELLSCLSLTRGEARMVVTSGPRLVDGGLRFLLLDPAQQFVEIVSSAHSVVVAGGTMQPLSEFRDQLYINAGAHPDRVTHFRCDHVVPPDNILPRVVCSGPTGARLDFSFQFRDKQETLAELGRVLVNLVNIVPGGLVVFFPSYDYERLVFSHLSTSGVLARLEAKKKVYREPKLSSDLDKVLSDYGTSVRLSGGAVLLAVVGGKMSEGINFSDDLGRCVVMVGLPYPNLHSPELKEKMSFLDRSVVADSEGKRPGQVHYDNLCMKAVNQSVGRAIRHINDYAAILFLDHRYSRPSIISQLPAWISKHVDTFTKFGPAVPTVRKFFKDKVSK